MHIWTGSIVLSGIVGLLLSYVLIPPLIPSPQAGLFGSIPSRKASVTRRDAW